jgi:hypothetical protein
MDDHLGHGNGHRNGDRATGRPQAGPQHALSYPQDAPTTREVIADLLDDAHASLSTQQLAALLLAVRRMTGPANGLLAAVGRPPLEPAAAGYLRGITRALAAGPGPDGAGRWLDGYLDDVAARPRGSALPKAA